MTQQGFRSPQRRTLLPSTVKAIRLQHRRIHRFRGPRPRQAAGFLTVPQLAHALGLKPHWLYHQIRCGRIDVKRDPNTKLYLFPDRPSTLEKLRRFQRGAIGRVSA